MEQIVVRDPDYELWVTFAQASYAVAKARQRELLDLGTSEQRLAILFILTYAEPPVTPTKVARLLGREPHSVLTVLRKMENEGLVDLSKDLPKRNQVRVAVTDKGIELYRHAQQSRVVVGKILNCLTKEERDTFGHYVVRLRNKAWEALGMTRQRFP
jgi:DNA-binding MarR family transcriptional regulator